MGNVTGVTHEAQAVLIVHVKNPQIIAHNNHHTRTSILNSSANYVSAGLSL